MSDATITKANDTQVRHAVQALVDDYADKVHGSRGIPVVMIAKRVREMEEMGITRSTIHAHAVNIVADAEVSYGVDFEPLYRFLRG